MIVVFLYLKEDYSKELPHYSKSFVLGNSFVALENLTVFRNFLYCTLQCHEKKTYLGGKLSWSYACLICLSTCIFCLLLYRFTLPIIYFLFLNSFFHLRIFNIHESYILICVTFKYTKSKFLAGLAWVLFQESCLFLAFLDLQVINSYITVLIIYRMYYYINNPCNIRP
jgi:hypothetical protein